MSYAGPERRKHPPGRVIYSKGPIVRTLELLSGATSVLAIIALIVSISALTTRIDTIHKSSTVFAKEIQRSRAKAARDTCTLLRELVISATPAKNIAKAYAYLDAAGLEDCNAYAKKVVRLP